MPKKKHVKRVRLLHDRAEPLSQPTESELEEWDEGEYRVDRIVSEWIRNHDEHMYAYCPSDVCCSHL